MVEAEMDLAANRPAAARDRLTALGERLTALGMVLRDLERRALLVRVDRAERRPTVARDQAVLEADARARGVSLIARRLQGSE